MLIIKSLLGILYFAIIAIVAWIWGYEVQILYLLLPIAFNQLLTSLILFLRSNVSGLAMYRTDSLLSVLDRLLLILICGSLLLMQDNFKIEWFVFAQTTSLSITAIIAYLTFRHRLEGIKFCFRPALFWVILKKSYPYALTVFLMGTYTRLDGVMIERLLPNGRLEADIYASAYRLLDASNMLGVLFAGLLLPMFAKMLKERAPLESLLYFSWQLIWAGAVSLAVAVFFFQEEIMVALYDNGNAYSGKILGLLMLTFIAICCTYIFGSLLTANGNLRQMNQLFLFGVLLNVALNLALIPKQGALGAAIAALATQWFVAIGKGWLVYRLLPVKINIRLLGKLILFLIVCFLIAYVWREYFMMPWLFRFLASFICFGLLAFAMRFIHLRGILQLLPSQRPS